MCGIAGFVNTRGNSVSRPVLEKMTNVIEHRGPDASGFFDEGCVALGHRRLSIIDLSAGKQPMVNEDGSLRIIYNGEIFNHSDLRPSLEAAGHRYATHCDTETILHSYEQFGPDCLHHFRGMFSFAIWDRNRRELFCARDRLGIKPFYYMWDGTTFVFGSEIKALLAHPAVSPALEESVLPEYLAFGYTSGDQTMFSGIRMLMPGHHLTFSCDAGDSKLRIEKYWDIPEAVVEDRSEEEWIGECRRRLEETIQMRLMSDVPLGMFLSGGVDSSAIAGLMKRMVSGPVKTFSVGYREAEFSELSYAKQVSESLGTQHHEVTIGMEDFFNALPQLVWHEDKPITWPSSVSLYFVSRLASQHVKVVLTGEGSDELFAGYGRYRFYLLNHEWMRRYNLVPAAIRDRVRSFIASSKLLKASQRRKLKHTFLGCGESLESLYIDNFYSSFSSSEIGGLLGRRDAPSPYHNFRKFWDSRASSSLLNRMLYTDQKTYLVELLMKQDRMSMATSIESRVPLLDHTFVEFSTRVPDNLKLRGATGKYIFKKAVEDVLPNEIVYRKKMGFPTPLRQWLQNREAGPLLNKLRSKDGFVASLLDIEAVNTLLDRHVSGIEDATDRIWRLINLEVWGDVFLSGKAAPQPVMTTAAH